MLFLVFLLIFIIKILSLIFVSKNSISVQQFISLSLSLFLFTVSLACLLNSQRYFHEYFLLFHYDNQFAIYLIQDIYIILFVNYLIVI